MDQPKGSEILNSSSFDAQFSNQESIQTSGGRVSLVDTRPEMLNDNTPIFLSPGWIATLPTYKGVLKEAYDSGRRMFTIRYNRGTAGSIQGETEYPMTEIKKVQSIIGAMKAKGIPQVDAIAYSEGAINTVIAAKLYPDKFRNIVLVNPQGIIGEDQKHKLTGRLLSMLTRDMLSVVTDGKRRKSLIKGAIESAKYIAQNPKRALTEIREISTSDVLIMLKDLHKQGIGIAIVSGENDSLFPTNEIVERLIKEKFAVDLYRVPGRHTDFAVSQEMTKTAINALNHLKIKTLAA